MVKEVLLTVEPEDVQKLGFQCVKCKAMVMFDPDSPGRFPESCPGCGDGWRFGSDATKCVEFARQLSSIRQMENASIRVKMIFNVEDA